jgi:hypothetical protein
MNGASVEQDSKMTKPKTNEAPNSSESPPMEPQVVSNGQDESQVRFSPSSPFVTMRHYISEFDPDENSTYMSMNALKLAESWKIYIDTFTDLCDIDKVSADKRRKLLLLLAGNKLRKLLSQLEAAAETTTTALEDCVHMLTKHFENRRAIQVRTETTFFVDLYMKTV